MNILWQFVKSGQFNAVLCGIIWALAFPNYEIAALAYIVPGYLLIVVQNKNRSTAFRLGYLCGLVYSCISLHWLLYIPVKFAPIVGWLALCAYLALYPAIWSWLVNRLVSNPVMKKSNTIFLFILPLIAAIIWVGLEVVRSRFLTGFPWNLLGVSQFRIVPLIQISSITGVYGVSFLIVWFSTAIAIGFSALIKDPLHKWRTAKLGIAVPLLVIVIIYAYSARLVIDYYKTPKDEEIKIALIQPSIPQTMIWDRTENSNRFSRLMELCQMALSSKPDILILPEAAIPDLFRYHQETYESITRLAKEHKVWLIIGADDAEPSTTDTNSALYYNSSFLISPEGFIEDRYSKQHLVMFGEYVPLIRWLPFLKHLTPIGDSCFTPGKGPVEFLIRLDRDSGKLYLRTSTIICFEDVIPHLVRRHITDNLDFLVNLTNDGWFRESSAQLQHVANAVFRAVENRRPLIRCTNNGLTCWIDSTGAIFDEYFGNSKDIYGPGFKIIQLPLRHRDGQTIYTRYGDWFGWSCVVISILLTIGIWGNGYLIAKLSKRDSNL